MAFLVPVTYLQFSTKDEIRTVSHLLQEMGRAANGDLSFPVTWINDPKYGILLVVPENPAVAFFEQKGLTYEIIPKENITAPYVDHLREQYPELSDEL